MMNGRHVVNGWLKTLGTQFGLDESGRCFLQPDQQTGIVVYAPDAGDEVFLYADLMRAPEESPPGFYERVLSLNASTAQTHGATVAFEPHSHQLLAIVSQPIPSLDAQAFSNILENLPDALLSLRTQIKNMLMDCTRSAASAKGSHIVQHA